MVFHFSFILMCFAFCVFFGLFLHAFVFFAFLCCREANFSYTTIPYKEACKEAWKEALKEACKEAWKEAVQEAAKEALQEAAKKLARKLYKKLQKKI